jgi:hypothetical protein
VKADDMDEDRSQIAAQNSEDGSSADGEVAKEAV